MCICSLFPRGGQGGSANAGRSLNLGVSSHFRQLGTRRMASQDASNESESREQVVDARILRL